MIMRFSKLDLKYHHLHYHHYSIDRVCSQGHCATTHLTISRLGGKLEKYSPTSSVFWASKPEGSHPKSSFNHGRYLKPRIGKGHVAVGPIRELFAQQTLASSSSRRAACITTDSILSYCAR